MNEYRQFLALAFHKGSYRSVTVGPPRPFEAQAKEPFADAVIGTTPWPAFRYSGMIIQPPADGAYHTPPT